MAQAMIDLETLGTQENAVIASVGIVIFPDDFSLNISPIDKFTVGGGSNTILNAPTAHVHLDWQQQVDAGRTIDPSTFEWWLQQKTEAQNQLVNSQKIGCKTAIKEIHSFLVNNGAMTSWGNGSTFDNTLIRSFFKTFGYVYPISFRGDRDFRTVCQIYQNLTGQDTPWVDYGTAHSALDDAISQTMTLSVMMQTLQGLGRASSKEILIEDLEDLKSIAKAKGIGHEDNPVEDDCLLCSIDRIITLNE